MNVCRSSIRKTEPRKRPAGRAGFSFVEIMIVVMLFLVMGLVALPDILAQMRYAKVERAGERVAFELRKARALAVSEKVPARVTFDLSKQTLTVWMDKDGDGSVGTNESYTESVGDTNAVVMKSSVTSGFFNLMGQFVDTEDTRTLTTQRVVVASSDGELSRTIEVYGGGDVRVKK